MKIGIIGAGRIGSTLARKLTVIVVGTGNYYPSFRDGRIDAIESGMTESGWVAQRLGRPVVKAFNNIIAHSLAEGGLAAGAKGRIALPVAGDDRRAKAVVIDLIDARAIRAARLAVLATQTT
jgi:predicted dinucleotide-binding enzyme